MPLPPARVYIELERTVGEISPLLFGGFAEHFGRCIYGGLYDPKSPHADTNGFRTDVLGALRDLKLSILRYPGGNFVSGYNWRDGVGPRPQRPQRQDQAWKSLEPNTFGTNEFIQVCRALGCQPMLTVNLGSGSPQEAAELVEYCNSPAGSPLSNLRSSHGVPHPHNVRYWCLGNEMDGPWQIGHLDAPAYAEKALETARRIKALDGGSLTSLAGSSGPAMPTFPQWDRTVLERCWEHVDFLSMHYYADNFANDSASFLAQALPFERYVSTIEGILRGVKSKFGSAHDVHISFDEWNVWYKDRSSDGQWATAPHLSEEIYHLEDALVFAQFLSTFLRHCDTIHVACIAQVVNALAPLLTTPTQLLKQSTYYVLLLFARYASGTALNLQVNSPLYTTKLYGDCPLLDASGSFNAESGRLSIFLTNRSLSDVLPVEILCPNISSSHFNEVHQLSGRDPMAANTFDEPQCIRPHKLPALVIKNNAARLVLPPISFTVLSV